MARKTTKPSPGKASPDKASSAKAAAAGERIAKVIARSGLCSRRDAERMIAEGRVTLGGAAVATPATVVGAGDLIAVDGKPLAEKEKIRLWRYHKPDGLVTTHRDEKGRTTVFQALPEDMPRVISIGRLDLTSEGLLLLTNDGGLARMLELPSTGWKRRYRARVFGTVTEAHLARLLAGLTVDGVSYGPIEAVLEREQGDNAWMALSLREGKNREIRKVLEHLGLKVNRLIRIAYGPFQLGNLPRGTVDEVPRGVMRAQLGHLLPDGGTAQGAAVAKPKPRRAGPVRQGNPAAAPAAAPAPAAPARPRRKPAAAPADTSSRGSKGRQWSKPAAAPADAPAPESNGRKRSKPAASADAPAPAPRGRKWSKPAAPPADAPAPASRGRTWSKPASASADAPAPASRTRQRGKPASASADAPAPASRGQRGGKPAPARGGHADRRRRP